MILILPLILVSSAFAALTDLDRSQIIENNLLPNGGFEGSYAGWTNSGGTFGISNSTSHVYKGKSALSFDSGSAGQLVRTAAIAITSGAGVSGQNGEASCQIKTPSGTATHTLQAYDGTNVIASTTVQSSSNYSRSTLNFPFPTSGNVYLRIVSVASDEPNIYVDDCYLGPARNLGTVSQAELYGAIKYAGATNCAWTTGDATVGLTDFAADNDCATPTTYGRAEAPATKVPRIKFSSLPPGHYMVVFSGWFSTETLGTNASMVYRGYDGSTSSGTRTTQILNTAQIAPDGAPVVSYFTYTTAQSNIEFRVRGLSTSTSNDPYISADSTTARDFEIQVYRFPTSAETAYRPDSIPRAPTVQRLTSGSGTYTLPTNPKPTFLRIRMAGGGAGGDGRGGSGGNGGTTTFGTSLLSAGGGNAGASNTAATATVNSPAILLFSQSGGPGQVGAQIVNGNGGNGGGNAFGPGGNGGTPGGGGRSANGFGGGGGGSGGTVGAGAAMAGGGSGAYIEALIVDPAASYSYSIGAAGSAGATGGGAGESGVVIVEEYYGGWFAGPLLVNSVTSNSSGLERVERASVDTVCSSSPCTISSQSGSWITSITRSGAGRYAINIASGIFSGTPSCQWRNKSGGSGRLYEFGSCTSATLCSPAFDNSGGAAADADMDIICMGPR